MTSAHDTSDIQDQIEEAGAEETTDEAIDHIVSVNELPDDRNDQSAAIEVNDNFDGVFADSSEDDEEDVVAVDEWPNDDEEQDVDDEQADHAPDAAINDDDAGERPDDSGDEEEERDDLKQIKGIGPSIEKTLNGLGVYRFHQIAEMSEYEIDRVARELRGFRSRVYREDWIGQARDLQYQKESNQS